MHTVDDNNIIYAIESGLRYTEKIKFIQEKFSDYSKRKYICFNGVSKYGSTTDFYKTPESMFEKKYIFKYCISKKAVHQNISFSD